MHGDNMYVCMYVSENKKRGFDSRPGGCVGQGNNVEKKEEMSGEICEVWNLLSKMQDGTNLERGKKKGNGYV